MIETDSAREDRITMDILVDIYDDYEIPMGWYYYLERTLNFPFPALWQIASKKRKTKGDPVEVVGMAEEEECSSDMVCEVAFEGDIFSVPLINLSAPNADEKTQEAIADWHYWLNRGNRFY